MNLKIPNGTPFQQKVWRALLCIPRGQVMTYGEIAQKIGHPRGARAVANACGANPTPIKVPCHRAVRSDGRVGGYSSVGGTKGKIKLLTKEGVRIKTNKSLSSARYQ